MSSETNRRLVIQGWKTGFHKVEFTKMQKAELGLGLADAKRNTDAILDGQRVGLAVSSARYAHVEGLANRLGAVVTARGEESRCR